LIKLKSELEAPPRQRHRFRLLALIVLVTVVALVLERWRGQWALKGWTHRMAAKGEIFEAERLWPAPSARGLEFSDRLALVMGQLRPGLPSMKTHEVKDVLPSCWRPRPIRPM
jgi:hypothetical protein